MQQFITGIQQVGIGVSNAEQAKYLYRDLFGMNILVFDNEAGADLMTAYTGGRVEQRRAILSMNMQGGGGFEIWQFTGRSPREYPGELMIGDIGIFSIKIKAFDVKKAYIFFSRNTQVTVSPLFESPAGKPHFWVKDSYRNTFNIIEAESWFKKNKKICGGVAGAVIGVADMDEALKFYKTLLCIDHILYDITAPIKDGPAETGSNKTYRRVLLSKATAGEGAFSELLGCIQIELIEAKDHAPARIFKDRYWGDCGFIHLCFDVSDMEKLKQKARQSGYDFRVDSNDSFSMGDAAGRFCYIEDPFGTLIELVETHKVPIYKKWGLYINLKKRKSSKPLPKAIVALLGLSKIK